MTNIVRVRVRRIYERPEGDDGYRVLVDRRWPRRPERSAALSRLRSLAEDRPLTLLTATKQAEISQATVLADLLNG